MKYLKKFESPNMIKVDGKNISFYDKENIPFLYSNKGNFYYGGPNALTHYAVCDSNDLIHEFDDVKKYEMPEGQEYHIRETQISGRIFPEYKIISFWSYPETYEEYEKVLKDIEDNVGIKFDDTWQLELPRGKNKKSSGRSGDDNPGELVGIYDYEGGVKRDEYDMKQVHLLSPEEKAKALKKMGWKYKQKYPIEWRHALGKWRGESMKYLKTIDKI